MDMEYIKEQWKTVFIWSILKKNYTNSEFRCKWGEERKINAKKTEQEMEFAEEETFPEDNETGMNL